MFTRETHPKMVYSQDTGSCLSAIAQFIARRGHPSTIYSDNVTNFVGTNKELKQFASMWQNSDLQETFYHQLVWKYNPAAVPHFGGSWERIVKACEWAIFPVLNDRRLTD